MHYLFYVKFETRLFIIRIRAQHNPMKEHESTVGKQEQTENNLGSISSVFLIPVSQT